MQLTIVDVFAERRYAGNQLAVVRDASGLSTAEMQDIAREMNFSETALVLESGSGHARARYFTSPPVRLGGEFDRALAGASSSIRAWR
jgi:trans-2,3-dihydro-3-hydroxyanthranilate isomerase